MMLGVVQQPKFFRIFVLQTGRRRGGKKRGISLYDLSSLWEETYPMDRGAWLWGVALARPFGSGLSQ